MTNVRRGRVACWRSAPAAIVAGTFGLLAGMPTASAQCALCKQALESGGSAGLINGFYWSIILLVSVPTLLVLGVGLSLHRAWRAKEARCGAAAGMAAATGAGGASV